MLDEDLKAQLRTYLALLKREVVLTAALDGTPASADLRSLLADLAEASPLVRVEELLDSAPAEAN